MTKNKGLTFIGLIGGVAAFVGVCAIGVLLGEKSGYIQAMRDLRVHSAYPINLEEDKSGLVIEHRKGEPTILIRQPNDSYRRLDEVEEEERETLKRIYERGIRESNEIYERERKEVGQKYRGVESRVKGEGK